MKREDIKKVFAPKLYNGMMSIPLYPLMTDSDADDVITAVKKVAEAYRA